MAKHMYPPDYDFSVVNDGIDRRSSMLRSGRHKRRSSAVFVQAEEARRRAGLTGLSDGKDERKLQADDEDDHMQVEVSQNKGTVPNKTTAAIEDSVDDLTSSMSALKFVPPSVRFGRGRGRSRGGFSKT